MSIQTVVDLRPKFGQIRNQGPRPTCMAFAASDAHTFARGNQEPLSVEYAFFYAVQRKPVPDPTTGVPFSLISAAVEFDGQPLENGWPYQTKPVTVSTWKPPANPGELFHRGSVTGALSVDTICTSLDNARPVMLIMDVSHTFFHASAGGVIGATTEPRINTHAVIAAGHGVTKNSRCILVRNSWGSRWADQGYAWLHEQYLIPRLLLVGIMN